MAKESFSARLTILWIGALFFWFITGFKGELSSQFDKKLMSRNLWTGYILSVIVLAFALYLIFVKNN